MFINLSNHPVSDWGEAEREEARLLSGEDSLLFDMPFPTVSPMANTDTVKTLAVDYAKKIREMMPNCVLIQGEYTFVFELVTILQRRYGIRCVTACSDRCVEITTLPDGTSKKQAVFRFARFREY